jgi:hypothetical protein
MCKKCKTSYCTTKPEVISNMPAYIQELAPFTSLGNTYIVKPLVVRLRDHVAGGGSFHAFALNLLSSYKTKHSVYEHMYYDRWRAINTPEGESECRNPAPRFSNFEDPEGWGGSVPSSSLWRNVWLDDHKTRSEWLDRRMMLVPPGPILKGDASFKASKLIYTEGRSACGSVFTLMNGRNEVRSPPLHTCCS